MLEEFRTLGGVAENIRLAEGPFGRGLFPIDPSKPVHINIPENLLVSVDHVTVENNQFRVSSESPVSARERAFLEAYERDFAWGPGRSAMERFLSAMNELPEDLRGTLSTKFGLGRFFHPLSPDSLKDWFFTTRMINHSGRAVVMPIVEMANHGGTASYDARSGMGLHGLFGSEVLVRYVPSADPLLMFQNWGFAPNEPMGFSLSVQTKFAGRPLDIGREFRDSSVPFVPTTTVKDDRIVLSFVLLGHKNYPRVAKGAFRRALASVKLADPDELYDFIQFANRQDFLDLLSKLEGLDLAAVPPLRNLALNQLAALSWHFGVRAV